MSEFDEIVTVRRIIELYRERGLERTEADVKKLAAAIFKQSGCSVQDAYESIEQDLLDRPPPPLPRRRND